MTRPRTRAAQASATDDRSAWTAEDHRLERCEQSLARLVELEDQIRAQRNVVDETSGEQRAQAVRVLRQLQARADEEMLRLNALRLSGPVSAGSILWHLRESTRRAGLAGSTARAGFIAALYTAADPPGMPARLRRRRRSSGRR